MDLTTINTIGAILGGLAALSAIIAGIVAAVWWASSMYHETVASRVANQQCVEVLKDVKVEVKAVEGAVSEVRGRVGSLEEWQRAVRARESTHSTVIFGADGADAQERPE